MPSDITYMVILLCLIFTRQSLAKCDTDFEEHGTKCFISFHEKMDFQNATTKCNSLNAQLPEPWSQVEFDRLTQVHGSDCWLGIRDLGLVSNQSTFSYVSNNLTVCYNGWKISEEQNSRREQAACTIFKAGRWQATECGQKHDLVCETISCPSNYTRKGKKCYNFVHERKNFQEASDACKNMTGWLAEPKTTKEKNAVAELKRESIQRNPGHGTGIYNYSYIGAKYKHGTLKWQHSGDEVSYKVSRFTGRNCLAMTETGKLKLRQCSYHPRSFICESEVYRTMDCDGTQKETNGNENQKGIGDNENQKGIDDPGNQKRTNDSEFQKGINYCQSSPIPCGHGHHRCISQPDTRYTCECGKGYKLDNKSTPTCKEVNKCQSTKHICKSPDGTDHKCVNVPGSNHSYRCECQEGYINLDDIFCDLSIEGPKPPIDSLPDIPMVKGVAKSLHIFELLFYAFTIIMDVRLFLAVIYRYCTTEPVPDTDSDSDDEEAFMCIKSNSKYWQTQHHVLEKGENIWLARMRVVKKIPAGLNISGDNALEDRAPSPQINSDESRIQSNLPSMASPRYTASTVDTASPSSSSKFYSPTSTVSTASPRSTASPTSTASTAS